MSDKSLATAAEVVAFWRAAGPDAWFKKDAAFDTALRDRFLTTHEAARDGALSAWEATAAAQPISSTIPMKPTSLP